MIGIGFDIRNIHEGVLSSIDIINLENPLYPNYLNGDYKSDITNFTNKNYKKNVITDGAYIDLNPGTPEIEIKGIVKKKILQSVNFAEATGSKEIIFLSTFLPMIGMGFYDNAHIENSAEFWRDVAIQTNIRISLCNTFEYEPSSLIKIAELVKRDNFGLAFDIGHAFAYGKVSLREFYSRVFPYCQTVYIHSNNKCADEHLNLREGKLLEDNQFQDIIPLMRNMNILLKPFDKSRLYENLEVLRKILNSAV